MELPINKTNFTIIFKEVFGYTMYMGAIKNRFRKYSIYPFNREAIDKLQLVPSNEFSLNKNNTTSLDSNITNPDDNIQILH